MKWIINLHLITLKNKPPKNKGLKGILMGSYNLAILGKRKSNFSSDFLFFSFVFQSVFWHAKMAIFYYFRKKQ